MTEDQAPPMSRPRVAAGALFFDEEGQVLLVKPTYKDGWDIPGGYVEPGETPSQACEREIREELGFERQVQRLLVVDWAPADAEGDKLLFVFDGGTLDRASLNAIVLPLEEIEDFAVFDADFEPGLMPDRLSRRLRHAVKAHAAGVPAYLEHGKLVSDLEDVSRGRFRELLE